MSAAATVEARGLATRERPGVGTVFRVELAKISAQLLPRLTAAVCAVGPFAFALFINTQASTPADSLFGRWVHTSGFAIPLVVLGLGGIAGFPLIASVVAGDIFAGEDGHSTWKTVLTRSASRGEVFWGKCLAAGTYSAAMVLLLAVSATLAGVIVVGTDPLTGLSGQLIGPGRALLLVAASFGVALVPTLAFACLGILFSVTSRNSMVGVLGPPVIGLVMVLVSVMGSGLVVRSVLPTTPFEAWHGLLVEPVRGAPLLVGLLVSLAWGAVCLDAARRSFRRRDFAGDGRAPVSWARFGRGVVVGLAVAAVLAAGAAFDRTWITSHRLEGSVAATFRNLVVQQQDLIGQAERTASLRVFPFCKREGTVSGPGAGAGDDWRCQLYVDGPRLRGLSADYSLTVRPNGCYTAEGPPAVIGPPRIHRAGGGAVVNPLYAFDGCMIVG